MLKHVLILSAILVWNANAEDKPYISVGVAKTKKSVLAISEIRGPGELAKPIADTIDADLTFTNLFKILDKAAFIEPKSAGIAPNTFKITDWSSIGAEFVLKAQVSLDGGVAALEAYLYDTGGAKQILAKRYRANRTELKTLGHTVANDIMTALTGMPGIFLTKIAMSCDRGMKGRKEIHVMDFDGSNVRQITNHRSISMSPAWSPDGTRLAYSVYVTRKDRVKNLDLYEFDFRSSTIRMLSNRKGMNSGAAYSPDGKQIALTMSFLGNPEVFLFEPKGNTVTRLTSSMGFDVDPTWSPDGKKLAFVSSRSGMPMVFTMNLDGSGAQRLTFAGRYNATPTWSPTGNKIGFAGWVDGRFDVFTMNPDGTNIERLTKDQGNNEDPHFSPDGNFIVFSSNRTGQQNIYAMNIDGTYVRRLTYGLGNCVSPKWSAPPRN